MDIVMPIGFFALTQIFTIFAKQTMQLFTTMKQTERIEQMEQMLNQVNNAAHQLAAALDKYEQAQEAVKALEDYYGSDEWKKDFADDEAGRLPKDLKRGVLSEDGAWNALSLCRELNERMKEIIGTTQQPTQ